MASSVLRFLDHTQRRTTVGRTQLDEWSARRRDLYLTTHNTHDKQTSIPPLGFEPTISACERTQTYAFDRAATGTGNTEQVKILNIAVTAGITEVLKTSQIRLTTRTYCKASRPMREVSKPLILLSGLRQSSIYYTTIWYKRLEDLVIFVC